MLEANNFLKDLKSLKQITKSLVTCIQSYYNDLCMDWNNSNAYGIMALVNTY